MPGASRQIGSTSCIICWLSAVSAGANMRRHPLQDVAVVGVYNSRQARHLGEVTSRQIVLEAIRGALEDAGVGFNDVDGLNVTFGSGYPAPPPDYHGFPYQLLGGRPCWLGSATPGIYAFVEAAMA